MAFVYVCVYIYIYIYIYIYKITLFYKWYDNHASHIKSEIIFES